MADLYRVRTVFQGGAGSPWLSTMNFVQAGGTAQQAANAASTFWGAVDNAMSTAVTWAIEPDVVTLAEANGALVGVTTVTAGSGTGGSGSDLLPRAVQGVCKWRTGVAINGRELRGRSFIPGLTEVYNTAGIPDAALATIVNAAAAALIADANSVFCVWHRPDPDTGTGGNVVGVVTGTLWTKFGYLGSRRD